MRSPPLFLAALCLLYPLEECAQPPESPFQFPNITTTTCGSKVNENTQLCFVDPACLRKDMAVNQTKLLVLEPYSYSNTSRLAEHCPAVVKLTENDYGPGNHSIVAAMHKHIDGVEVNSNLEPVNITSFKIDKKQLVCAGCKATFLDARSTMLYRYFTYTVDFWPEKKRSTTDNKNDNTTTSTTSAPTTKRLTVAVTTPAATKETAATTATEADEETAATAATADPTAEVASTTVLPTPVECLIPWSDLKVEKKQEDTQNTDDEEEEDTDGSITTPTTAHPSTTTEDLTLVKDDDDDDDDYVDDQ